MPNIYIINEALLDPEWVSNLAKGDLLQGSVTQYMINISKPKCRRHCMNATMFVINTNAPASAIVRVIESKLGGKYMLRWSTPDPHNPAATLRHRAEPLDEEWDRMKVYDNDGIAKPHISMWRYIGCCRIQKYVSTPRRVKQIQEARAARKTGGRPDKSYGSRR